MKTFIALTLLSSIAAAPAMAETTFTRDGETYSYEVKQSGSYQLISGRNLSTGENFQLRVRGSRVSGDYAGRTVTFATPKADAAQLASN